MFITRGLKGNKSNTAIGKSGAVLTSFIYRNNLRVYNRRFLCKGKIRKKTPKRLIKNVFRLAIFRSKKFKIRRKQLTNNLFFSRHNDDYVKIIIKKLLKVHQKNNVKYTHVQ